MFCRAKTQMTTGIQCQCGVCHACTRTRVSAVMDSSGYDMTCNDSTGSCSNDQIAYFGDQWLYHKDDLSQKFHTDLLLLLGNKEEIHLHTAVIVPHSAMLTQLLVASQGDVQTPTLHLPEVGKATVSLLIDLLYTGQSLCSIENFSELNNLLNSLGLKRLLQSLELSEAEIQHGGRDSNCCKVEPAEYTEQDFDFDSDEIIFIKEIFGGASDQLFPPDDRNVKSMNPNKYHERRGPNLNTGRNTVVKKLEKSKKAESKDLRKSKATFDCSNCQSKFSSDKQLKAHKKVQCGKPNLFQPVSRTKVHYKKKTDLNKIIELKSLIEIEKDKNKYDKFTRGSKSKLAADSDTVKVKPQKSYIGRNNLPPHTGEWNYKKGSTKLLSSRQVVHGRNNITWAGKTIESYEDVDVNWVKKKMEVDLRQFEDVTEGEKSFFCSWNKFLIDHKPGVAKVHLKTILEEFVDQWGKEVMKSQLYIEFVTHLAWLEQSGLISQQSLLTTVQRLQGLGN